MLTSLLSFTKNNVWHWSISFHCFFKDRVCRERKLGQNRTQARFKLASSWAHQLCCEPMHYLYNDTSGLCTFFSCVSMPGRIMMMDTIVPSSRKKEKARRVTVELYVEGQHPDKRHGAEPQRQDAYREREAHLTQQIHAFSCHSGGTTYYMSTLWVALEFVYKLHLFQLYW